MFILEYTKTIDDNGNRIPAEQWEYERYGKMIYNTYEEADQDRTTYQWSSDNIYIRVKELSND